MSTDDMAYDFSPGEFDNHKQFKEKRKFEAEYAKMMEDCIKLICDTFNASISSHRTLKSFLLHRAISLPFTVESFEGSWKNMEIYFCIFMYSVADADREIGFHSGPKYFSAVLSLKQKYPHTIVQPETMALKIENLFSKNDIDFKHAKKFSRRFHVICKNKTALELLWHNKDLNKLAAFPGAEFEITENKCYLRPGQKPISLQETEKFIEFLKVLSEVL